MERFSFRLPNEAISSDCSKERRLAFKLVLCANQTKAMSQQRGPGHLICEARRQREDIEAHKEGVESLHVTA